jgi:List-Bact-rpt repeat protein
VALNASADPGSSFEGWSGGGCSGRGPCTVNDTATVTASFRAAPNSNRLTVVKAGTGNGTVTSNPSGISCGTACAADFAFTTIITLTAVPAEGSTFVSWSVPGCGGTVPSCTFSMTTDETVVVTFSAVTPVPMSTLNVEKSPAGTGSGTVTSDPSGINCGNDCTATFQTGNTVRLMAAPASGSTFAGWSGACSGTGDCMLTMNTDQTVSARFDLIPQFVTLTVTTSGQGNGTVTSAPQGINCPGACTFTFLENTDVTVTASPDLISTFGGWKGSGCGNEVTCTIRMDNDKRVDAQFNLLFGP